MRALVTGGLGFVGSNLALELEKQNFEVVLVDHNLALKKNLDGFRGEILEGDLRVPLKLSGALDVIFHQAALTDPRYHDDKEIYEANIAGYENVIALARDKNARLVYASTAGLYGNGPTPMQEDQPKEILTSYGQSKLDMDRMLDELTQDLEVVGLRYFNVFGPREAHKGRPASMIYHLSRQMKTGTRPRVFENGEQQRDHIYVKDVVLANLCAMKSKSGIYNVGTGIGTSFNELVKVLNSILRTNLAPDYFPMPYDPKTYQHHTIAETTRAKKDLGFEAKWELPAAIRDYLNWLDG